MAVALRSNGGRRWSMMGKTLPGCLLLRFEPDGRCSDLREYWNLEPGLRKPFPGWGE